MPVKVVHVITRMNVGGPSLHLLVLSERLRARGYETVLVAGVCEESAGDMPASVPSGQRIVTLEALSRSISPLRDLAAIWTAYKMMRRERPSVVHTHTAKAGLVGRVAARLAGVPVIVHTFHGNSLTGYFPPAVGFTFRLLERLLGRITDRVCVVSQQQLEEIAMRFRIAAPGRFRVVPLGLDLHEELHLAPAPYDNVLTVGWLGRLVDIKGVPLLAAVIDEAVWRGLRVRFSVGGDGPDRLLVESAVARHGPGRVQWSGWRSDVRSFLSECHVLIQTSRNEGTPVALIQGMAAARPFVSTPAGGVVDLVHGPVLEQEGGCSWYANGVLATPEPAAFVRALSRFQSHPSILATMGARARSFAAGHFQAERLIGDVDRMYSELLREKLAVATVPGPAPSVPGLTGESQCRF